MGGWVILPTRRYEGLWTEEALPTLGVVLKIDSIAVVECWKFESREDLHLWELLDFLEEVFYLELIIKVSE